MYIDINTLFTFEVPKSDDQNILAAIVHERLSSIFVFCDRIWIKQKATLKT
jgi:hypothetical protein